MSALTFLKEFWPYAFWLVALAFSGFYASRSHDIHVFTGERLEGVPHPKVQNGSHRFHQFWFNLTGSLAGWLALRCLIPQLADCAASGCRPSEMTWGTVATVVIALLGVTGYLPLAIYSLVAYGLESYRKSAKE